VLVLGDKDLVSRAKKVSHVRQESKVVAVLPKEEVKTKDKCMVSTQDGDKKVGVVFVSG
jgi:hypothetical protein